MTTQLDISTITRLARQPGLAGDTLAQLREAGMKAFIQRGLPAAHDEEWRFTNTDPLAEIAWQLTTDLLDAKEAYDASTLHTVAAAELVFVNGKLSPSLTRRDALPQGVYVGLLADAPADVAALAMSKLASTVGVDKSPFAALNAGFLDQVAIVHVARGVVVQKPISILNLAATATSPLLFCPRVLVIAEAGANFRLAQSDAGETAQAVLSNTVTELFVGRDAVVEHYQTNWLSQSAWAFGNTLATLAEGAHYTHHSVTFGGKLSRNDLEVVLDGQHADATLNGLVLVDGDRQTDNHTLIRHEKANCGSHELYKHVVDEKAFGVFKGKIFVQKDAQKTDARQTNRTLLLSDRARMESMPALEIYADDVKCSHGSTTGPLDEDMLFYLRSRGLTTQEARSLLIYAFAADMTARIKVPLIRRKIETFLAAKQDLPQDLSIEAM